MNHADYTVVQNHIDEILYYVILCRILLCYTGAKYFCLNRNPCNKHQCNGLRLWHG